MSRSVVGVARAVVVRQKYYWPDTQLNIWTLIMLLTACLELGIFSEFISIQNQMRLPIPWIFPYGVTVGAVALIVILIELILIGQRRLFPGVMLLCAFILFVLFMAGAVETGIQLFGPPNVNGQCQLYVDNNKSTGPSMETLAWMQQNNICSCWRAAFAFWIIGAVFLIWMFIMAFQVSQGEFESH